MATNSTPDVFLLLGVEGGSNIGKGSGELIRTTLKQILANIEKEGLSVKVNAEIGNKTELENQIKESLKNISASTQEVPIPVSVQVSRESVVNSIQAALNSSIFNINLSTNGINLSSLTGTNNASSGASGRISGNVPNNDFDEFRVKVQGTDALRDTFQQVNISAETTKRILAQMNDMSFKPLEAHIKSVFNEGVQGFVKTMSIKGIDKTGSTSTYSVNYDNKLKDYKLTNDTTIKFGEISGKAKEATSSTKNLEESLTRLYVKYKDLESIANVWSLKYSDNEQVELADVQSKLANAQSVFGNSNADLNDKAKAVADLKAAIATLRPIIQQVAQDAKEADKDINNLIAKGTVKQIDRYNRRLEKLRTSPNGGDIVDNSEAANNLKYINNLRTAIETGDYNNVGVNNYKEAIAEINRLLPLVQDNLSDVTKQINQLDREAKKAAEADERAEQRLSETLAKAEARRATINNTLDNINSSQLDTTSVTMQGRFQDQQAEIDELIEKLQKYRNIVESGSKVPDNFWDGINDVNNLTDAVTKLNSVLTATESNIKGMNVTNGLIPDDAAISAINKYNEALRNYKMTVGAEQYQDLYNLTELDTANLADNKKRLQEIANETQRLTAATKTLNAEYKKEQNIVIQRNKIYQEADNYYKKYQSGIRANLRLNQQWQEYLQKLNSGGFGDDNESARRALAELQTATKDANAETLTLWGSLKKLFTDHFGSVSATAAIGTLRNVLRGMYQNVLDIDKAMTELRKVTDLTEQQYESFQRRAADMAREVGGSIADTIATVSDYSRLGYTLEQSESLGRAALVYKNVGDGIESIGEATESIISTLRAFNIEAEDSMQIIDVYNNLGNNLPISSGALGTALQKSASALAAANNTFSESAAMIAAANSVVQNEEVTGTALKTISMYLRAAKTEAAEAGIETEGMAESVSKLRQEILDLTGSKVDIMLDDETFKSTYQIIKEISEIWDDLSDITQANILEKIGGKRNANINAALIENFDIAIKAVELAEQSSGSALAENEKFLDSIAGHISKLTVAYEDLSQTVLSSDMIKYGVDFLTEVVKGLTNIVGFLDQIGGILPTITAIIGSSFLNTHQLGFGTALRDGKTEFTLLGKTITGADSDWKKLQGDMSNKSFWQKLKTNVGLFGSTLNQKLRKDFGLINLSDIETNKNAIKDFDTALSHINAQTPDGLKQMDDIFTSWTTNGGRLSDVDVQTRECANSIIRLRKASKDTTPVIANYGKTMDAAGKSTGLMSTLGNAAKNILANIGSTLLSAGIAIAINLVVQGLINLVRAYDNAVDKIKESTESIEESENNLKSYNDELRTTRSRIAELQSLGTLNLFEQDELSNLKRVNAELEEKIRLEKLSIEQAKDAARENALRAWLSMGGYVSTGNWLNDQVTNNMGRRYISIPNWFGGTTLEQIQGYTDEYQNLTKRLEEFTEEEINVEHSYAHWLYKQQQEIQTKILEVYKNQGSNISQIILGLDPEKDKEAIELLNSFLSIMREINGEGAPTTFTEVWESADYVKTTAKLAELAKQEKLTTETFENVEGIEDFKTALEAIGKTNIYDIIQAIIDKVTESGDEAETASEKITLYAESLAQIKDTIDSASSERSLIQDAYKKIISGESLTDDEVEKFRGYPELFGRFTQTTDGWTISVETLANAYSKLGEEVRKAISEAKADTIEKISLKREEVGRMQETLRAGTSSSEAKQYGSTQSRVRELNKEIEDGISSLSAYDNLLKLFPDDLADVSDTTETASELIEDFNSKVSIGTKAQKEMQEQGHLSASTYLELVETVNDYYKYIQIENGAIKFNYELFKEQSKAKIADEIATLELARAEALYNRNVDAMYGGRNHERLQAILDETELKLKVARAFYEDFDPTWEDTLGDKPTDTTDSDYQRRLNKLKDANDNTIESERQFIKDWTALNEEMYKATDPEKYEDNLREIREYIKGLNGLLDTYLEKWGKVNSYDENSIASRTTRLAEARRVNYSTYGDPNSLFYNLDTYEKNAADQAKYEADTLKLRFDRGLDDYQTFISDIRRIRESARDRDGNYLLDMTFVSGYEDRDKQFSEQLDMLQRFNDKSLDDEAEYVRQWKALNDEIYKGTDITKYESNLKEIANYERDLLDRRFKEGLISAEDYRAGLISLWEDNNAILGEGVLNEWLSGAVDNEKAELDRLYSEGKISAKEYFDYVEALWEESQNILGQRTQEEWLEDAWKKRAETEKTYWEQQKDLATDYYDAELKKLQDVKDEEEKISKAEELRLNLIKARKALEDAKSQRNQLVFHNGTFEYMADQEAVMSAQEEIAEALKAIKDNELEEQIKLLEEQKDEALLFYDNIIGMLDYYLNDTKQILTSDSEVIDHAEASESGQYFRRLMNGEITMDEVKEEYKKKYTKDPDAEKKAEEKRNTWSEQAKAILGMGPAALMQLNLELWDKAGFGVNVGALALGSATAQDIASSAVDNVYNNSSINNDNSVKVGDIHMTIQGGTSVEMLHEFASKLGSAISTLAPRAIAAI